ncbi:BURP domain-containing protein 5 [Vitis vinifera]|uniref:BURP domain-containing protein 5 n=1 Tax=Vitis vinifera TaxID=29760 RepID=A0A438G331_VITVI|nr:BURP domain-containing protein 5 [Vitis vinifera]
MHAGDGGSNPCFSNLMRNYWKLALPCTPMPKLYEICCSPVKGLISVDASAPSCNIHNHFNKFSQPAGEEAQVDDSKIGNFFLETDLHPGRKMKLNLATTTNGAVFLPHQVAESMPLFHPTSYPKSLKPVFPERKISRSRDNKEGARGMNVNVLTNEVKPGSQEYEFGVGMKKTRTYMIPLVGADGSKAKAMAACHSDTSAWHPKHVAFKVLNVKPGTVPVCHFLHNDAMVWIPK